MRNKFEEEGLKVEKKGQLDFLKNVLNRYDKLYFDGAADGIKYLKNIK